MEDLITLLLNRFAQDLIDFNRLFQTYQDFDEDRRESFKEALLELICQSRCRTEDVDVAINHARIKPTKNCCVIARKGVNYYNLRRLYEVDKDEITICLLVNIFKIGYARRRKEEYGSQKWWNTDLSSLKEI